MKDWCGISFENYCPLVIRSGINVTINFKLTLPVYEIHGMKTDWKSLMFFLSKWCAAKRLFDNFANIYSLMICIRYLQFVNLRFITRKRGRNNMKLWISTFAITESALSVPNPFEDESKVRFSSMIVPLLLFRFAFRADAFRATSRPENAVCDLLLDREPEAPLNGVVRNRNHVNLRPPHVEYRNSRDATYRRYHLPDWLNYCDVTFDSREYSQTTVESERAVSDPKSNAIYYERRSAAERFANRFDKT